MHYVYFLSSHSRHLKTVFLASSWWKLKRICIIFMTHCHKNISLGSVWDEISFSLLFFFFSGESAENVWNGLQSMIYSKEMIKSLPTHLFSPKLSVCIKSIRRYAKGRSKTNCGSALGKDYVSTANVWATIAWSEDPCAQRLSTFMEKPSN